MMEFNVMEFVNNLSILQLIVFIMMVELMELFSGLLRAWKEGKEIRSAITMESIVKKFEL